MKFNWPIYTALAICAGTLPVHAASAWEERYYNPKPASDDVVLPMPCDGKLVFRKVVIPISSPLDDLSITVGQEAEAFAFVDQRRPAYIAGSFTEQEKKGSSSYYLIAKYELTTLQHQALSTLDTKSETGCPKPSRKGMLPTTGNSWFDVVRLAHLYNIWLRKYHKDALPKNDETSGFVRLPTEVEWEFAARGGIKVDIAAFSEPTYPMPEGLTNYEWFAGPQSSNTKIQQIGLLQHNPVGLHDILGNVAEMTQDAFHLIKLDRQHGGTGAYVIRGGDFRKSLDGIRSSARREGKHYTEEGQLTETNVGLRFVVAAPALTSRERVQQLEQDWKELGSGQVSADPEAKARSAVQELRDLAGNVQDDTLKETLKDLEHKLRASNQRQEEARNQAIRSSLNLGAFLCTKLRDDGRHVEHIRTTYASFCSESASDEDCLTYKANLDNREYELGATTQYYASSLVDAATLYGNENIAKQVPVIEKMLEQNEKLQGLIPYLEAYWTHQQAYLKSWKVDKAHWLSSCTAISTH